MGFGSARLAGNLPGIGRFFDSTGCKYYKKQTYLVNANIINREGKNKIIL